MKKFTTADTNMNSKSITGTAAQLCGSANFGSSNFGVQNDWFLPSVEELTIYRKSSVSEKPSYGYFWTSTQVTLYATWEVDFNSEDSITATKSNDAITFCRAVRAF